jgi:capsular polysaccharide biosynthesis protein
MSVNVGIYQNGMISGREAASTALSLLQDISVYEKMREMLSFDMRLQACQEAVRISVPLETNVVHIEIVADEPYKVQELSEAVYIVADSVLRDMPQIEELDWNNGQTEIRDDSYSQLLTGVLFAALFAVAGGVIGAVIAFVLVIFDTRIHFVDEISYTTEVNALLCIPNCKRVRDFEAAKLASLHKKTAGNQGQKEAANHQRQKESLLDARAKPSGLPSVDSSVLLYASQTLLSLSGTEASGEHKRGASILLLPVGDPWYYRQAVVSIAAAFRMLGQRVLLIDFSEDAVFIHPYPEIGYVKARNTDAEKFKEHIADYKEKIAAHDVTLLAYGDLAASAETLDLLQHCDLVEPLVRLHRAKILALRRLTNQLINLKRPMHGIVYTCSTHADKQRNLL